MSIHSRVRDITNQVNFENRLDINGWDKHSIHYWEGIQIPIDEIIYTSEYTPRAFIDFELRFRCDQ